MLKRFLKLVGTDAPIYVLLGQLTTSAVSLVTAPLIARVIGPDGRGVTAAVIAAAYIVPILVGFGVPSEVRRRASVTTADETVRAARVLAIVALIPSTAAGLLLTITVFSGLDHDEKVAAFVAIACSPAVVWWMTDLSVLIARQRYRAVFLLQVTTPICLLIFVLWMFSTATASPSLVIYASTVGGLMTAVVSTYIVRITLRGARAGLTDLAKKGATFAGAVIAEAATNRVLQVAALPLLGSFQTGLLSAALTLSGLMLVLGQAMSAAYFRRIARDLRRLIIPRAVRESVSLATLAALALALVAPFIIPLIFGSEFSEAIAPAVILVIGGVPMVVGFVNAAALTARGAGLAVSLSQITSLFVQLALVMALSGLGAVGAAAAIAGGYLAQLMVTMIFLRTHPSSLIPTPSGLSGAIRAIIRTPRDDTEESV